MAGSNLSDAENDAKFRTFRPTVKIRRVVSEISTPIVDALPTTELRNTFDGHPLRGC